MKQHVDKPKPDISPQNCMQHAEPLGDVTAAAATACPWHCPCPCTWTACHQVLNSTLEHGLPASQPSKHSTSPALNIAIQAVYTRPFSGYMYDTLLCDRTDGGTGTQRPAAFIPRCFATVLTRCTYPRCAAACLPRSSAAITHRT